MRQHHNRDLSVTRPRTKNTQRSHCPMQNTGESHQMNDITQGEYSCNVTTGSGSLVGYIHVFVAALPRVFTDIKSFDDTNATEKVSVKVLIIYISKSYQLFFGGLIV